jgi:hypothetical protein
LISSGIRVFGQKNEKANSKVGEGFSCPQAAAIRYWQSKIFLYKNPKLHAFPKPDGEEKKKIHFR